MPLSALEWGLVWKVRRKVCTFHACMPYRPLQHGVAWKVILFKARQFQKESLETFGPFKQIILLYPITPVK